MNARATKHKRPQQGRRRPARLGRLHAWLHHHRAVAFDSLRRLLQAPFATVMTWLVIGIACSLPAALVVGIQNVERLADAWQGSATLSVYLKDSASEADAQQLAARWRQLPEVEGVVYISKAQALEEFRQLAGYQEVLASLSRNPLPAVLVVTPRAEGLDPAKGEALRARLAKAPQVEEAELDLAWLERLQALLALGRHAAAGLGLLLGVGVLMAIGNTVRLAIESRRDEILVVRLVGGTDAFVRRPFLYTGLWFGLGGGVVAVLALALAAWWLSAPVARLAGLYGSSFVLQGLPWSDATLLVLVAAELGWLGAWLAVGRHLSALDRQSA